MNTQAVPSSALARKLLAVAAGTRVAFRVVLSDGAVVGNQGASPAFTITFRTRGAERRTVAFGYVGLLESYCAGSIDIDGDIALAFRTGFESGYDRAPNPLMKLRNRWHEWRFSNRSIAQAKANARYHYGLGEAFYRYWLDTVGMMYTCAYRAEGTTTLEQAQKNKMDHVCRKVQRKPGGLGVIHFIGHVGTRDTELFIRKHLFPGGWIPSLSQRWTAQSIRSAGRFSIVRRFNHMVRVEKKAGIRESHRSCNIPSLSPSRRSIRQARRTAVRGEHFAVNRLHRGDSEEPEYLFRQGA